MEPLQPQFISDVPDSTDKTNAKRPSETTQKVSQLLKEIELPLSKKERKTTIDNTVQQLVEVTAIPQSREESRKALKKTRVQFIASTPVVLQDKELLAKQHIEVIFALGVKGEPYAKIAFEEILRRCPRLLPDLNDEKINSAIRSNYVDAVYLAKGNYTDEVTNGQKSILAALKDRHKGLEKCKTLELAMAKPELLTKVDTLILKNPTKKPMLIPDEIGKFTQLKLLSCPVGFLTEISSQIGSCKKLERLFVPNNLLTSLPDEIVQCKKLEHIDLVNNHFDENMLERLREMLPNAEILDIPDY